MIMEIIWWCWLTVGSWIMFVVFSNIISHWFKYVCIKMLACKICAKFHSLTKMSPDWNSSDCNVSRLKQLRLQCPQTETAQTKKSHTQYVHCGCPYNQPKSSTFHESWQWHNSFANCASGLFKPSKGSASLQIFSTLRAGLRDIRTSISA